MNTRLSFNGLEALEFVKIGIPLPKKHQQYPFRPAVH